MKIIPLFALVLVGSGCAFGQTVEPQPTPFVFPVRPNPDLVAHLPISKPVTTGGETLVTLSGVRYEHAVITGQDPEALSITYEEGVSRILFTDLPLELQQRYDYDPDKAETYRLARLGIRRIPLKKTSAQSAKESGLSEAAYAARAQAEIQATALQTLTLTQELDLHESYVEWILQRDLEELTQKTIPLQDEDGP